MDIYLSAKCAFVISTTSGLEKVAMVFRRPSAYVNYLPYDHLPTWGPNDLAIPKLLWSRSEGRYLSFPEIVPTEINLFGNSSLYEERGLEVVENTPEDIKSLAIEMDERLKGTWETTEDDAVLQDKFWSLFKPSQDHGVLLGRAGAHFLRENRHLVD